MHEIETIHISDYPLGEFYVSKFPITVLDWNLILGYIPENTRENLQLDHSVEPTQQYLAYKNNVGWAQATIWTYLYSQLTGVTHRLMSIEQWEWLTRNEISNGDYFGDRWLRQKPLTNQYSVSDLLDVCSHWTSTDLSLDSNDLSIGIVGLRRWEPPKYFKAFYTSNRLGFRIVSLSSTPKQVLTFLGVLPNGS
jgi:hypothetical protein